MSVDSPASSEQLYSELAPWWRLLSPPEHYVEEADAYLRILAHALAGPPASLLELGSGVGHHAANLPADLDLVLVDRSAAMLEQSRISNPDRRHVQADMRTLDLGRRFDAVLLHDAVMYLLEPEDLRAALDAAARHLRPGGALLVVPDVVRETFEEGISGGGGGRDWGEGDGRAARLLEWTWDPDPTDDRYRVDMSFLLREADGTVRNVHDVHILALRDRPTWWRAIRDAGLQPVQAPPLLAAQTGEVFLSRLPG